MFSLNASTPSLISRFVRCALGANALLAVNAHAATDQPATELAPVIVTAARSEQLLADRLSDVTIIDAETIALSGQSSLGELLQRQHGIELTSSGGAQSTTSVFIRGSNPSHTLVLIDGLRIGSSTAGGASLNAIPLAQIERIEILRGPSSSLYGADAIGGVLNIITRKGKGPLKFNAEAGVGTRDTYKAAAGLNGASGAFSYALQLAHDQSRGFSSIAAATPGNPYDSYNSDRDGYDRHSVSSRLAWDWADGHTLAAQMLYSNQDGQFDGGPNYDDREYIRVRTLAISSTDRLSSIWNSRLRLGHTIDDSTTVYSGFPYRYRTRQVQMGWQNDLVLDKHNSLTLGVDRLQERIAADYIGGPIPASRTTHSLVGVYQLHVDKQRLQFNVHGDDSSQYGTETTGGVQYGYQILPALRVSGSMGTAFRAPSFNDLYYPDYGQTTIRPERSFNRELGLYMNGKGFEGSVVAYNNKVNDLIAYQAPCASPGFSYGCAANIKNASLRGLSLAWTQQWNNTNAAWSADWLDAVDRDSDLMLPRRARYHGTFSLSQQIRDLTLGAELQGSSQRYEDTANTTVLSGYGLLNLFANYQFSPVWSVLLRANNVTDRDYELADGYATEGASLFMSIRYQQ